MLPAFETLRHRPKSFLIALAFFLVAALGGVDYLTGYELSFSIFYLAPVFLVSWTVGRTLGVLVSLAGAGAWLLADLGSGHPYSHPAIPYWNASVRLGLFWIVTYLTSELKHGLDRERERARTDPLTGAANRRSFQERAEGEIQRARRYRHPFTVAYFDLDNFKAVNDRFGHSAGDALLRAVVETVQHQIRATDLLARLGGDEFAVLFPETPRKAAGTVLEKLHSQLAQAMEKNRWPITFSIGAVTFRAAPASVDEMLKKADAAMYTAKRAGKNRIHQQTLPRASAPKKRGA